MNTSLFSWFYYEILENKLSTFFIPHHNELFGDNAERPIDTDVVEVMLKTVDAIEARHMKGIIIDVGMGVKAKVAKMAKESIKVERSETSKKTYEE